MLPIHEDQKRKDPGMSQKMFGRRRNGSRSAAASPVLVRTTSRPLREQRSRRSCFDPASMPRCYTRVSESDDWAAEEESEMPNQMHESYRFRTIIMLDFIWSQ